jgi:hypothetical protein
MRWTKDRGWSLDLCEQLELSLVVISGDEFGGVLTPRRFRLSSLCLGTIVTISISHRKATSMGVSPGCNGKAMLP